MAPDDLGGPWGAQLPTVPIPPLPEAFVPYHKIPKTNIHEDLIALEREGESVVSVTADGTFFHVFTAFSATIETRDAVYNNVAGGAR